MTGMYEAVAGRVDGMYATHIRVVLAGFEVCNSTKNDTLFLDRTSFQQCLDGDQWNPSLRVGDVILQ